MKQLCAAINERWRHKQVECLWSHKMNDQNAGNEERDVHDNVADE